MKKILSLLLAITLIVGLVACGKKDEPAATVSKDILQEIAPVESQTTENEEVTSEIENTEVAEVPERDWKAFLLNYDYTTLGNGIETSLDGSYLQLVSDNNVSYIKMSMMENDELVTLTFWGNDEKTITIISQGEEQKYFVNEDISEDSNMSSISDTFAVTEENEIEYTGEKEIDGIAYDSINVKSIENEQEVVRTYYVDKNTDKIVMLSMKGENMTTGNKDESEIEIFVNFTNDTIEEPDITALSETAIEMTAEEAGMSLFGMFLGIMMMGLGGLTG